MNSVHDQDRDVYLYDAAKRAQSDSIAPAILVLGALATAGLWINDLTNWIKAVAVDPLARPDEAAIAALLCGIAAYYAWRTVRMAYLMASALCFLTYDSVKKIIHRFNQPRRHP